MLKTLVVDVVKFSWGMPCNLRKSQKRGKLSKLTLDLLHLRSYCQVQLIKVYIIVLSYRPFNKLFIIEIVPQVILKNMPYNPVIIVIDRLEMIAY